MKKLLTYLTAIILLVVVSNYSFSQKDSGMDKPLEKQLAKKRNSLKAKIGNKIGNKRTSTEKEDQMKAVANALKKGDKAIDFTLMNATGEKVNLYDELKKGPVVLTWYRGAWCPYCNLALKSLQESLPEIKAQGATLIAITPQLPDNSLSQKEKNHLEFEILSDVNNKVGKEYGIIFKLGKVQGERYNKFAKLDKVNGNSDRELPIPATYIIDQNGKIIYSFLDTDYTKRAEPSDLINALKELK
ncbi:MAG: peroxiredoxin-like family protein [Hyphomicrobiales bacterium]